MSISRNDLITAIIKAQDNNDKEYQELLKIYNTTFYNDIQNYSFTKEFFINDNNLVAYISKAILNI